MFSWRDMMGSGAGSVPAGGGWGGALACALGGVGIDNDGLGGGIQSDARGVNPQLVEDGTYHVRQAGPQPAVRPTVRYGAIARIGDLPRDTVPARSLRRLHCG